ncbi:NAD(P)/FAD-dependent oxidoreductase [uncultured Clostridium sp.]|uniref:NAD(P)/FAD-dependent oxidoreductase n=1 Tax=uncultured Clostridium sp. TaxID=59620 RepID=UPI00260407C3|nr:NAD(P)/FAD-dependent oxidoreductase [uncultured Clostridium sp.]
MIYHDLIIIGGGASGMMAAISAKDFGLDVAIIEGTDKIGRKILMTGNGRCNITNSTISHPFDTYHSENDKFYQNVLGNFSVEDTKAFFLNIGLPIIELQKGKCYPKSLQASSVVDILKLSIEERDIPVYTSFKVNRISKSNEIFKITPTDESMEVITSSKVILACGGKSATVSGSDGSGYILSKQLGHKIIGQVAGIVQLKLEHHALKSMTGVKFDGYTEVVSNGKSLRKDFGEILFTNYGISGPPILQISRTASYAVSKGEDVRIVVDMMPDKTEKELELFLDEHFGMFSMRGIVDALIGVINKKLIITILKESGIRDIHKPCCDLSWKEKKALVKTLKSWEFKCTDSNGFTAAQVTAGGVDTNDIDPVTLESKLVKGLFFCGEVMDVDGDCGGFNLQWAWSSGFAAALGSTK